MLETFPLLENISLCFSTNWNNDPSEFKRNCHITGNRIVKQRSESFFSLRQIRIFQTIRLDYFNLVESSMYNNFFEIREYSEFNVLPFRVVAY